MVVSDNTVGLLLAIFSSAFIGASFILKKKGLKRAAVDGTRAGVGGYTYLLQPLWWTGMVMMIVGETANFVCSFSYSPWCTQHYNQEKLPKLGVLGCLSCIVGSVVIIIHAPQEQIPNSVQEIWSLATEPGFLIYVAATMSTVLALILYFEAHYGQTNVLVYLGICSLTGAITVMSIKAIGIAIKLSLEGINQLAYPQTWFFLAVGVICVFTQLNYLNKALDTFNAAVVSPIYYVMFTTLTIVASAIMFKDWSGQNASSIASEICGFITILSGTVILHATREQEATSQVPSMQEVLPGMKSRPKKTVIFTSPYITPTTSNIELKAVIDPIHIYQE